MRVEINPNLSSLEKESEATLKVRLRALTAGIGLLKLSLSKNGGRDLVSERMAAGTIDTLCNCDGEGTDPSITYFNNVSNKEDCPIVAVNRPEKITDVCVKSKFLGIVQGCKDKPWVNTSDKDEWYLHFRSKDDDYYAPVKGLNKLSLAADGS